MDGITRSLIGNIGNSWKGIGENRREHRKETKEH